MLRGYAVTLLDQGADYSTSENAARPVKTRPAAVHPAGGVGRQMLVGPNVVERTFRGRTRVRLP